MPNTSTCPVCTNQAEFRPETPDQHRWQCPRCGDYSLTGTAESIVRDQPLANRGAVSGWIRRQNSRGVTPRINNEAVDRLRALTQPPFRERVEQYLLAAAAKSPRLDQPFNPVAADLVGSSYSADPNELAVILEYLQEQGFMTELIANQTRRLTPRGYIAADDLRSRRAKSTQAFVAMWLTDEMKPVYDKGIDPGIRLAGFTPMLIPKKEHTNKIDDEIIAEIRRSAFVVADFTGHRQNVYFETGFAIGLGLQVIWTCRKDHIEDLHFDIRQYNSIDWSNEAELAQRLQRRIEAMFGQGPLERRIHKLATYSITTAPALPLPTGSETPSGAASAPKSPAPGARPRAD